MGTGARPGVLRGQGSPEISGWLLCARWTAFAARLREVRVGDLAQPRILAKPHRAPSVTARPALSRAVWQRSCNPSDAAVGVRRHKQGRGQRGGSPGHPSRAHRTRRRAGGLTWHGGVAGGHWRSGRLLVGPGSGDRASTSRYPLVHRAFPCCGRPAEWAPPASHNAKLQPVVEGPAITLAARHAKVRREGYAK